MGLWSDTHADERERMEWRDHRTNLVWHPRGSSPILGSARVHCAHLAREESAHWERPGVGIDDLSALHMRAPRQGWVSRPM